MLDNVGPLEPDFVMILTEKQKNEFCELTQFEHVQRVCSKLVQVPGDLHYLADVRSMDVMLAIIEVQNALGRYSPVAERLLELGVMQRPYFRQDVETLRAELSKINAY